MAEEETLPQDFKFDATVQDQMGSDSQVNTLSPSKAAATESGAGIPKKMWSARLITNSSCKSR